MQRINRSEDAPEAVICGEIRPRGRRDHENWAALDFNLVISKFEPAPAQLSIPGHHDRFHGALSQFVLARSKRVRHIIHTVHVCAHGLQHQQ